LKRFEYGRRKGDGVERVQYAGVSQIRAIPKPQVMVLIVAFDRRSLAARDDPKQSRAERVAPNLEVMDKKLRHAFDDLVPETVNAVDRLRCPSKRCHFPLRNLFAAAKAVHQAIVHIAEKELDTPEHGDRNLSLAGNGP